jgi:transposase InsO family protein
MPSSSIRGYVYYVSFIDDYSRKTWIYFLKTKDEVFSKFKEFKALIENLSERKTKILKSDNGGEYTSKEFVNFCKYVGIKRDLTTPYNPQQNGVAERCYPRYLGITRRSCLEAHMVLDMEYESRLT